MQVEADEAVHERDGASGKFVDYAFLHEVSENDGNSMGMV